MDGSIRTVLGDVAADWIGPTFCHEHLYLDARVASGDPDAALLDEQGLAGELREARRLGLSTVVDLTDTAHGRDPAALRRIAEASGVQVVASSRPEPASGSEVVDVEALSATLAAEIERGIGASGARAGIIGELGAGATELGPRERTLFEAAAMAQRRTGAPLVTHTDGGALGPQQVELLLSLGVEPRRVLVAHMDSGAAPLGACVAIARRGAYVGIDRVGDERRGSDEARLRLVLALAERGLLDRVLLSHDIGVRSRLLAAGGHGYGWILEDFAPRLRENGLSDAELELLLIHNPRRFLAFSAPTG